jgi:peptidoglycan/xylan/chitin deacetylase (PgdA/CDA1 family)
MNPIPLRPCAALLAALFTLFAGCTTPGVQESIPELDIGPTVAPPEIPEIVTPPLPPVAPTIISHGPRARKRIALTFDGCSLSAGSYYDERVTKVLVEMNVPATIFLGGKWMLDHPDELRLLASLPQFELASHGYLHPHMTRLPDERVRQEIKWTQDMMFTLVGRQPTLFRAPYGEVNERVAAIVANSGLRTVQYDLPSGDADKKASRKKLVEYVSTVAKPGAIVVMHINRRGWHTAEALPEIITNLRKRGFELVTVSELMGLAPPPPPAPLPALDTAHAESATDESALASEPPSP